MSWNNVLTVSIIFIAINNFGTNVAESKKYPRCELAKELVEKYQISKTFLSNWICLIEHESDGDTKKVTTLNNGTKKFGLFQIRSKECKTQPKVEVCDTQQYPCCKMKCEDFLNDDIADDVLCAKRIFEVKGFQNWSGWSSSCRDRQNLPNLNVACNINAVTPLSRFLSHFGTYEKH